MEQQSHRARKPISHLIRFVAVLAISVTGMVVQAGPASAVTARCTSGVTGPKNLSQEGIALYGGIRFARGSYCEVGDSRLYMQSDGNLVLYSISGGRPVWAANTRNTGARAVFQTDGNFVVYNSSDRPVWASNTCCVSSILGIQPGRRIHIRRAASAVIVWSRP